MRGLLNAEYVLRFDKIPPLLMRETIAAMQNDMPSGVVAKLNEVIEIKSKGLEKETVLRIPVFDEYFAVAMNKTHDNIGKRRIDYAIFDSFLCKCLGVN
jgi:hypothetical protein